MTKIERFEELQSSSFEDFSGQEFPIHMEELRDESLAQVMQAWHARLPTTVLKFRAQNQKSHSRSTIRCLIY